MEDNRNIVYGYCRISTKKQNIDRQVRNILATYPNAIIYKETFTGTKMNRPEWNKLYNRIKRNPKVTLVFDEVSRMSRNADEGFSLYMELFSMGVNLVFLKEPHINTDSYKQAMQGIINVNVESDDSATDEMINTIMNGINKFMQSKVKQDIYFAFEQAQKDVEYLHMVVKEGIETARLNGKQIGGVSGKKLTTQKSIEKKKEIQKHSIDFGGSLNDVDCMKLTGLSRNTYYNLNSALNYNEEGTGTFILNALKIAL